MAKPYKKIKVMSGDLVQFDEDTGRIIGFKNKKIVEGEEIIGFEISLPDEDKFQEFKLVLAGMISSFGLSFYLNKYLDKKLTKQVIESVVNNHIQASENEYYYLPLTRILLDEYFLQNDKIDLSCFIRYNVTGMKEELKSISQYEVEMGGKLITANDGMDEQQVFIERKHENQNGNDDILMSLVTILRDKYKEMIDNPIFANNNVLHVFSDNGTMCLANNALKKIDYEFFEKNFEINLGWLKKMGDSQTVSVMTCLIIFIETFTPNNVVLYSSVPEEFVKDTKFNIGLFNKKHQDSQVDLFFSKAMMPGGLK